MTLEIVSGKEWVGGCASGKEVQIRPSYDMAFGKMSD
jgi:hypothetical protein